MNIQINQLNEIVQKKIENQLNKRKLTIDDISIEVNGPKIEVRLKDTQEIVEL